MSQTYTHTHVLTYTHDYKHKCTHTHTYTHTYTHTHTHTHTGVQVLEKMMTNHTISVRAWRLPQKASRQHIRDSLVDMRKVLVEKCVVLCNQDNVALLLDEVSTCVCVCVCVCACVCVCVWQ
jgi:hypothetical protein